MVAPCLVTAYAVPALEHKLAQAQCWRKTRPESHANAMVGRLPSVGLGQLRAALCTATTALSLRIYNVLACFPGYAAHSWRAGPTVAWRRSGKELPASCRRSGRSRLGHLHELLLQLHGISVCAFNLAAAPRRRCKALGSGPEMPWHSSRLHPSGGKHAEVQPAGSAHGGHSQQERTQCLVLGQIGQAD